ncbi:hypothetical protein HQ529_04735 [Candidatus Woesearchaeota archaeon]|nr:hypothetical protein [Candidatus Woesearchaeota archaeon]
MVLFTDVSLELIFKVSFIEILILVSFRKDSFDVKLRDRFPEELLGVSFKATTETKATEPSKRNKIDIKLN